MIFSYSPFLSRHKEDKTDGIVEALTKWTDVDVVSPKAELIAGKSRYETYSKWGDATHWTQRGAFVGYQTLMKTITGRNREMRSAATERKDLPAL